MARQGFPYTACAPLAKRDLNGGIPILVQRLDLRDPVIGHVKHGHRERIALVSENARHADLSADQSYCHD
jgi:hypothetical protein